MLNPFARLIASRRRDQRDARDYRFPLILAGNRRDKAAAREHGLFLLLAQAVGRPWADTLDEQVHKAAAEIVVLRRERDAAEQRAAAAKVDAADAVGRVEQLERRIARLIEENGAKDDLVKALHSDNHRLRCENLLAWALAEDFADDHERLQKLAANAVNQLQGRGEGMS